MKQWLNKLFISMVDADKYLQDYHSGFGLDIIPDGKNYPLLRWSLDAQGIYYEGKPQLRVYYPMVFDFMTTNRYKNDGTSDADHTIIQYDDELHRIADGFWQTLKAVAKDPDVPYTLFIGDPKIEFMSGQMAEDLVVCRMSLTVSTPHQSCFKQCCQMPCIPQAIQADPNNLLLNSQLKS